MLFSSKFANRSPIFRSQMWQHFRLLLLWLADYLEHLVLAWYIFIQQNYFQQKSEIQQLEVVQWLVKIISKEVGLSLFQYLNNHVPNGWKCLMVSLAKPPQEAGGQFQMKIGILSCNTCYDFRFSVLRVCFSLKRWHYSLFSVFYTFLRCHCYFFTSKIVTSRSIW